MNKALSSLAILVALVVASFLAYSMWTFMQFTPIATVNFTTPGGDITYSSYNVTGEMGVNRVTDLETPNLCFWAQREDGKQSQNRNDGPHSIALVCHFAASASTPLTSDDRLELNMTWAPNGSEYKIATLDVSTAFKSIARLRKGTCIDRPCEMTVRHLKVPSKFDENLEFDFQLKTDFVQNSPSEEVIFPSVINFKGNVECPLASAVCPERIYQLCMSPNKNEDTLQKCKKLFPGLKK